MTMRTGYRTPFVGRVAELRRLAEAVEITGRGTPMVVLLTGEAGVGKTRLLVEFTDRALADDVQVLVGGCADGGDEGIPYGAVVEALRGLGGRFGDGQLRALLGADLAGLAGVLPSLSLPVEEGEPQRPVDVSGDTGRLRFFEGTLRLLQRLCERGPVVLVVEDLHWANDSTRDILGFLVRNLDRERFLLVASYRSDEQLSRRREGFLFELERRAAAERIHVAPFAGADFTALVEGILRRPSRPHLVERVFAQSDGNPFFAEELLTAGGEALQPVVVPIMLRELLLNRLRALSEDAQETLRAMAVCGRSVDHGLLAEVAEPGERQLLRALREIHVGQLIVSEPSGRYTFRHALTHEAVYQDLLPGERRRLHARAAAALERRSVAADQVADQLVADQVIADQEDAGVHIAHHWFEAHDHPRAVRAAIAAARATASGLYAFSEADRLYSRALQLWGRVAAAQRPAEPSLVGLLQEAADVARWVNEPDRAAGLVEHALSMVDPTREPVLAGILHQRLGLYFCEAGDGRRALEEYEQASALVSGERISDARAQVLAGQSAMLMLNSRYAQARARCEEALPVARGAAAAGAEAHLLDTLGFAMVMLGSHAEGVARLYESRALAGEIRDLDGICRAYTNLATVLPLVGRNAEALAVADEALALMRRHHVELSAGAVLLGITASVLFRLGAWDRAEAMAQAVLDRSVPNGLALFSHITRIELDTARGDLPEAARRLGTAGDCAQGSTDPMVLAQLAAAAAELAIWQGDHAAARTAVCRGLDHLDNTEEDHLVIRLCMLGLRADADRALGGLPRQAGRRGDGEHREALIARAREAATAPTATFPEAYANLLTCEAEYERAGGNGDLARWSAAAEAYEGLAFPFAAGYARYREAELALAGRQLGPATAALLTSRRHIAGLCSTPTPLLGRIQALARRGRITLDGARTTSSLPVRAGRARLTPRELDVLNLLQEGCSNRQIGQKLFITEKTASVHIGNILAKLGVERRGQAVATARRLGLIG